MSAAAARSTKLDPQVYLANMAQLWRWDPQLATRIDAVRDEARPVLTACRSGGWTTALRDPAGVEVYLHSLYDPAAEAEKWIAAQEIEDHYGYIVAGFGLGWHLAALRRRLTADCVIVVTEPSLPLLAAGLAVMDLADALSGGRLIILNTPDKAHLHDCLRPHTALLMLGARFLSHAPSERIAGPFHAQMRRLVTDFVAHSRTSIMTLVANSEITCRNIANNLSAYVVNPPINALRRRFTGNPAIVVSAGPSLRRNIDVLAAAKGRAVLCAVQTALKPLMARGITPDFVTCLDFHKISRQYYEGVSGLENVHLVAEPKATWHVIDHYPGPVSLLDNEFARLLIGDELAARDGLPAGATVAHLAFYLAVYMGCDPIVLVGQDLAFSGHAFYIPGVEIHRTWRSELNRFQTLETKEWERIVRNRKILRRVDGNDGRSVYTDELLFTYLEQFEKDISRTSARVINATEGGARIRGTQVMPLAEVIAQFCSAPLHPALLDSPSRQRRDRARLPAVRDQVAARLGEIDAMEDICARMLKLLAELEQLTHDPARFNQVLVGVDQLRAQVSQHQRALRIINSATQLAELRRFSADRRLGADAIEGVARAKRQLKRDAQYVGDVLAGAGRMRQILAASLERLDSAIAGDAPGEQDQDP